MEFIDVRGNSIQNATITRRADALAFLHQLGNTVLAPAHESKRITTDMDGVLIHDDNAVMAANVVFGAAAVNRFDEYARLNIKAVQEGEVSYCWYAPTVFVGALMRGLSPEVNRAVGQHMRLIPDAQRYMQLLQEKGYDITAVTAGHQEAAEEVSRRLGISRTFGTQLGTTGGLYNGSVERFVGGKHKLAVVDALLRSPDGRYEGTHIGDSWSDIETLAAVPHSVAYNPGCEPALRGAKLSVISPSLLGLLPLLDDNGACDGFVHEEHMPKYVILMREPETTADLSGLLAAAAQVKKVQIEESLRPLGTAKDVEARIRETLQRRNIPFRSSVRELMPPEQFDLHAKDAYAKLSRSAAYARA